MRKYYPGITLFKLAGALLVLMGHITIPTLYFQYGQVPGLQQAVAAIVPCFYMISGFLAYKGWMGTARPQGYIRRYLGGLAALYATLCGLALLLGNGTQAVYSAGAWHNAVLPLLRVYLVVGPYTSLWFVPPLLVGVAFCYYCQQRGRLRWAIGLAVVGFVAAQLLGGTWRVALEATAGNVGLYHWKYSELLKLAVVNYLGLAVPFILAGVLVARHEAAFVALPAWRLAVLALGSTGLEFLLLGRLVQGPYTYLTHPLILSILPVGVWLFYGVLHISSNGIRRYHAAINRFSALLYFSHQLLLPLSLSVLGLTIMDVWNRRLTAGQTLGVMLLTVLQVGLLAWVAGRLLARRPPAAPAPPAPATLANL